jgi:ech hydrogenase subunit D
MNEEQSFPLIPVETLLSRVRELRDQGWRLVQIGAAAIGPAIEVTYSFDRENRLSNLRVSLPAEGQPRLPSIASVYACSFLYENEMHDLFGIQVDGMAVDFKGKFYHTTVPFPFAARKT